MNMVICLVLSFLMTTRWSNSGRNKRLLRTPSIQGTVCSMNSTVMNPPTPTQYFSILLGTGELPRISRCSLESPISHDGQSIIRGKIRKVLARPAFCKPAKHGGVVAWHQDYSYWTRTQAMQHLTCWVALDDATEENGCLQYVPKSHNWGLLDKPELAGDMDGLMDYLTEEQKAEFKPVPIELPKGYATFHHPLMVHGSYENKSNRSRRALVINIFADGTISATNDVLLEGVPVIPKGQKMEGQFFPLLYNTELDANT